MKIITVLLLAAYLGYLIWEDRTNRAARSSFQHVIHVNGTRGKTGTARMIDACLRKGGYRVFTKTTGSDAAYIGVDGVEHRIRRLGPASVQEQFRILRQAGKEHAEIVVIECMAVKPELQKLCQEKIVRGDLNVITNVRYDHLFEMGPELQQIAESLSETIPDHGTLFTADRSFYEYFTEKCAQRDSRCILCENSGEAEEENAAIAVTIGTYLGIEETVCREGLADVIADYATRKEYRKNGHVFLNFFSANDPQSTLQLLHKYGRGSGTLPVFVYNNREDRPDRVLAFAEYFFSQLPEAEVLITGQCRVLACRIFRKHGVHAMSASTEDVLQRLERSDMAGIGNVKGEAETLLERLEGVCES